MKIYIVADIEGISGVVLRNHAWVLDSKEYLEQARGYLMKEVNAAINAAYCYGADEVVVNDSHCSGFNMSLEEMDPRAQYIQGSPRKSLLYGIDEGFDGIVMVGAHAMSGTVGAVLDHTMNVDEWIKYQINGIEMGEIGIFAIYAGYYNVPVIFVSGDMAAVNEAKQLLKQLETVVVKTGYTRTCARLLSPILARKLVYEGVGRAMRIIEKCEPIKIKFPAEIQLEVATTELADRMEANGAVRICSRIVGRTAITIDEIVKF